MRKTHTPERALLFMATLYSDEEFYLKAKEHLINSFGELLFESECLSWVHSEYYRHELGWPITRRFFAFRKRFDTGTIREVKLVTNKLEEMFSVDGRRKVNLDPGYITEAKVVLATTKNYPHRIYLGSGIFAEVTLFYTKGKYRSHQFTYRDYGTPEYLDIFHKIRELLRNTVPLSLPVQHY